MKKFHNTHIYIQSFKIYKYTEMRGYIYFLNKKDIVFNNSKFFIRIKFKLLEYLDAHIYNTLNNEMFCAIWDLDIFTILIL